MGRASRRKWTRRAHYYFHLRIALRGAYRALFMRHKFDRAVTWVREGQL